MRTPAFAGDIGAERETHVLLAMQKVEGSNPFSRFARSGSTEPQTVSRRACWPRSWGAISGPGAHWVPNFVVFWSTTGQTPGNRLLQIRVSRADDGAEPSAGVALFRFGALVLAALPLFAGCLPILLDDRRRGAHDMLAGTVVVPAPPRPAR
jgi:uncharacterized RDD family membrane protein YckC